MESRIGQRLANLEAELLPAGSTGAGGVLARVGRLEEILEGAQGEVAAGLARRLENLEVLVFGVDGADGEGEPEEPENDIPETPAEPSAPPPKRAKVEPPQRGKGAAPAPGAWTPRGHEDLATYARRFGFNRDAVRTLHELPPHVLENVKHNFTPKPDTKDVSALFISFARSCHLKQTGMRLGGQFSQEAIMQDAIHEFAQRWNLNGDAVAWLQKLDLPQVLEEVVTTFAPNAGTNDVSGKLISFTKSVYQRRSGKPLQDPWQWRYG
ncbi:unnamed protein product [Symbiodinium natans]|uniref:Uncharacterized protein n=1 Tax=Symbiodinium natans TaxID=878477 RepID=A0A812INS9_9DINO|nr:unnamed protein product [Symbiodinium natans]